MSGEDAFFVARAGAIWACFLDGKPAVKLGTEEEFWKAVTSFYDERHPEKKSGSMVASLTSLPQTEGERERRDRIVNQRAAQRHSVSIVGKVFTSGGSREAIISDLSATGCKFDDYSGRMVERGGHLTVKIGTVGPIPATVRWSQNTTVGVLFDAPLHRSVLEHIRLQFGRTD